MPTAERFVQSLYPLLHAHYGLTGWWPADTAFEMAIGAILTQNTAWRNVERAIAALKARELLSPEALAECDAADLEQLIRPTGYFRQKARRVQGFARFLLERYAGDMDALAQPPLEELRPILLGLHGIGPETADDILLYACNKPVFVVDAYTRRICARHGHATLRTPYHALQELFEKHIERDIRRYQELHALLVFVGRDYCRTKPRCEACPLRVLLEEGHPAPLKQ